MNNFDEGYGKLVDAGFDYLTATSTPKRADWHDFNAIALHFMSDCDYKGMKVTETRESGYDGYKMGETFYGTRTDSAIWRTSGSTTRHVARFLKAHDSAPKITRADLQLTFEPEAGNFRGLEEMQRAIRGFMVGASASKARKSAAFYQDDACSGFTAGNRVSQTYCRAYLAGLKHPDRYSPDAVRFEVEWKGKRGQQIWELFGNAVDDATLAGSYVGSSFLKYGINEPMQAHLEPCKLAPLERSGSDEKTVAWLRDSVSKTLERMIRAGYGEELRGVFLDALYPKAKERRTNDALEKDKAEFPLRID